MITAGRTSFWLHWAFEHIWPMQESNLRFVLQTPCSNQLGHRSPHMLPGGCRSGNSGSCHKWQLSQWTYWYDTYWQEGQTRQPVWWGIVDPVCVFTLANGEETGWATGFPLTDVSHNRALSMKWVVKYIVLLCFPSIHCVWEAFRDRQGHLKRKNNLKIE